MNYQKYNKGMSLLDLVLILSIFSAMIIAAFIQYPKIQSSQRVEMEAKNITTIIAGVRGLYAGKQSFEGLDNTLAISAKIIPPTMIPKGARSTITNQFKGNVRLYSSNFGISGTDNSSFTLIYNNIPAEDCTKLLTTITADMGGVSVNGNRVKEIGEPLNREDVAKYCYAGKNNNTINMTSY